MNRFAANQNNASGTVFSRPRRTVWYGFVMLGLLSLSLVLAQISPRTVTDASGRSVTIHDDSRVVAIGSGIAETIYALKAESKLVGVDTSSNYPEAAKRLAQVGARKSLGAEGVLSLRPSLVIATTEAGPPSVMEQIRNAGVTVLVLNDEATLEGAKQKISGVARALGLEARGDALVRGIDLDIAEAKTYWVRIKSRPRVIFIYSSPQGSLTVAGKNTAADGMIRLAGGINPIQAYDGYKPINAESVVQANPDVIVMLDRGLAAVGGLEGLLKAPGVMATNAGRNKRIVTFEGTYLLGFGPRVGKAVLELSFALHPEIKR